MYYNKIEDFRRSCIINQWSSPYGSAPWSALVCVSAASSKEAKLRGAPTGFE